ncbi:MAG: hypothetical protein KKG59_04225, partial [Nanoarchaeota archaeon]|nr:hypothetical protein [Nanoarchaeota archaeon]
MLTQILIVFSGIIIIILLAQVIIKNSVALAKHYGLSGTFIGLTILSIGTSIPEIMTHIIGSFNILSRPEQMNSVSALLLGTNIGSDIFQQNLVLPVIGLIGTIVVLKKNLWKEMGVLVMASVLVWLFALGGLISRLEGAILLLAYIGYLIYLQRTNVKESIEITEKLSKEKVRLAFGLLAISFIIMAVTTDHVLEASIKLVKLLPISASFFGVIVLGVASALPEL